MHSEDKAAPRWWWYLLGLSGVAVVILSWMAPEPQTPRPAPVQGIQTISYTQCTQDYIGPGYGTRSVSDVSGPVGGCLR